MRVVSWNINSLRARQERVEEWIAEAQPDVLLLQETKLADDHKLHGSEYPYMEVVGGQIVTRHAPALTALNERLRDDWVADVQSGKTYPAD